MINSNYSHLYIAVGALIVAVILLNTLRPYFRKKKHIQEMRKADHQEAENISFNHRGSAHSIQKTKTNAAADEININIASIKTAKETLNIGVQQELDISFKSEVDRAQSSEKHEFKNAAETSKAVNKSLEAEEVKANKTMQAKKSSTAAQDDLVMLSVHAPKGRSFGDYDFLQTLGAVGLAFGDHKIFHYDVKTDQGVKRLFSVAKLNKPGVFDIDNIESMDCQGLLLFVNLKDCARIQLAVDCLLDVAQQLADELDGILFEGYNTPWTEHTAKNIIKRVESYPRTKAQASYLNIGEAFAESVY